MVFVFVMAPVVPVFAQESPTESLPAVEDSSVMLEPPTATDSTDSAVDSEELREGSLEKSSFESLDKPSEEDLEEPQSESLMSGQENESGDRGGTRVGQRFPKSDLNTGALINTVPLHIPPGRNGVQPNLALTYNSQSAEEASLFGSGWSLSIPYIERINKTGVDKLYTDDFFSSSLSGELFLISGSNWGPKIENGDFLIYSLSSNVWTVKDKKGTVYKFGNTASARQDDPGDSTKIYKWLLEEVRDTNDNYIDYEYYKDAGQIYPSKITYTGNGVTDGIFEVEFLRQSRSDVTPSYKTGFSVTTNYRINEIQAKVSGTWVRKYTLSYSNGDNGSRSLLTSITESGQENSVTASLPASTFTYQTHSVGWQQDSGWDVPYQLKDSVFIADVNGDGLPDMLQSYEDFQPSPSVINKSAKINQGNKTWATDTNFTPPVTFYWYFGGNTYTDMNYRLVDLNGDGLVDILGPASYLNTGSGWSTATGFNTPLAFNNSFSNRKYNARLADVNGDGLVDMIRKPLTGPNEAVYLNSGTAWVSDTGWSIPLVLEDVEIADVNGDGLADILQGHDADGSVEYRAAYLNNGNKGWTAASGYNPPVAFTSYINNTYTDKGLRLVDGNGDGLPDLIPGSGSAGPAYINNGNGWTQDNNWFGPLPVASTSSPEVNAHITDLDGDGLADFIQAYKSGTPIVESIYLNEGKRIDLLSRITQPTGGYSDVVYKSTPLYRNGSAVANSNLPVQVNTVYQVTNNDGLGNTWAYTYHYEGGRFYFASATDRRFAGFSKVTETDAAGYKTKTYYHQGDTTNSSQGEYSDSASKIGKAYRVEVTDASDNIYTKTIIKWESYDLGNSRSFVKRTQQIVMSYDGDADHKDKAETFTYSDTTGNLTESIEWGEVTGSDNGTFSDTGTDKFTTTVSYASNTGANIIGLPSQETTVDQASNKVRETKHYYDVQSLGSVTDGNETKTERWKTSSTYIDTEKTYNTTYGIVTQEKDPRDKVTSYSYDAYSLYPTTVTNPLSQATAYTYDYSSGKVKTTTDPNTRVFETVYDGLDRPTEEKQPDLTTPSTLVTRTVYAYTSQSVGTKIQRTDYLDASTSVDTVTYTDGFDRLVQTRREMEDTNTYAVTDNIYNNIGQVHKESLPYSSSGSAQTTATTTADLLITYSYDAMLRVTSIVNAVGTTSHAFDDWKQTVTDPRNKVKHFYKDAYGSLVRVDETNSGNTYTTAYDYNGNRNLTKITDALGNVRNFTYDGLGRRLTAQDLHATADATYGTWTYTYDDAGNLTSVLDPKSQTINYTHDDINRVLTEDYTGQAGTEVTYTYDSGTDGVGRLTSVAATGATTAYLYNPHGQTKQETKTIDSTNYQTSYSHDRQGNVLEITNPDSSKVKYAYNTAGQLETVQRKESTDAGFLNLVTDFDYGPHGKITYTANVNGTTTINTYDDQELYRLVRKQTSIPDGTHVVSNTVSIYPTAGDGSSYYSNSSWDTLHDRTIGTVAPYTDTSLMVRSGKSGGTTYRMERAFIPFDTSSLPDDATITEAKLKVYVSAKLNNDNDGDDWVTVVQGLQSSPTSLTTDDFDMAGAIDSPTEGNDTTERKDITNVSTNSYLDINLNSTGRGWISKTGYTQLALREGHDVLDTPFVGISGQYNSLTIRTSEYEGTTYDPILEVTYEVTVDDDLYWQDINYTYDANGNVTQIIDASQTNSAKTVDYAYDDLNRLTSATATNVASGQSTYTHTYTYDAIGNLLTRTDAAGTYSYSGHTGSNYANPHAPTSVGSVDYTYDNNGNMLTETSGLSNTWDYNNRLTQAVKSGVTSTYAYDHAGQRVALSNGTATTYCPTKFYNIEGSNRVKHIFAGNLMVATVTGTGASASVHSLHTDHLTGSNVVTNSGGTQQELLDYFPYGNIRLDQKAGAFGEQRKYAGHEYDVDTQLSYMNARYYSGNTGRFISQDPMFISAGFDLSDPQSFNAYSYARNNPLRYIDPNGESFMDIVKASGGYAVGLFQGVTTAAFNTAVFAGMAVGHPIQTSKAVGSFFAEAGRTAGDITTNPQARAEIKQGAGIAYNEFETKSAFEQGRTIGNITGQLEFAVGAGYKTNATIATKGNTVFPENPNYLMPELGRDARGSVYPKEGVRIRSEKHSPEIGKNNSPRHVGQHYHVDVLKPGGVDFSRTSNYNILKPETYIPGWGKGFLPGEKIPKF